MFKFYRYPTQQIQLKLFLIQGESFPVSSCAHALSRNVVVQYLSMSSYVNSYLNGRQLVLFKLEDCFNHSLIINRHFGRWITNPVCIPVQR